MEVIYARCAGLDVHKKTVVGCVIHTKKNGHKAQEKRAFGTTTEELQELLARLLVALFSQQRRNERPLPGDAVRVDRQALAEIANGRIEVQLVDVDPAAQILGVEILRVDLQKLIE